MKNVKKPQNRSVIKKTDTISETITQNLMDGFWVVDMLGNFLNVNDACGRMTGYSQEEFLEMNIADVEADQKPKEVIRRLHAIMTAGEKRFLTDYRCKNGKIIDVEVSANYVKGGGGKVVALLRNMGKHKRLEETRAKSQAQAKQAVQEQLNDSHRQMGKINRKIPLLLELANYPASKRQKQKVIEHILDLAMNISQASTGYLYRSHGRGKFSLLSSKGIEEDKKQKIAVISTKTVGLLRHLIQEKTRLSGDIKRFEAELLALDNKLAYFVTLPLSKGMALKGFIFLGFDTQEHVDTQELEFLDVFAMHASAALMNAEGLK